MERTNGLRRTFPPDTETRAHAANQTQQINYLRSRLGRLQCWAGDRLRTAVFGELRDAARGEETGSTLQEMTVQRKKIDQHSHASLNARALDVRTHVGGPLSQISFLLVCTDCLDRLGSRETGASAPTNCEVFLLSTYHCCQHSLLSLSTFDHLLQSSMSLLAGPLRLTSSPYCELRAACLFAPLHT